MFGFVLVLFLFIRVHGVINININQEVSFDKNYVVTWGQDHVLKVNQGKEVQLSMDHSSGPLIFIFISYRIMSKTKCSLIFSRFWFWIQKPLRVRILSNANQTAGKRFCWHRNCLLRSYFFLTFSCTSIWIFNFIKKVKISYWLYSWLQRETSKMKLTLNSWGTEKRNQ